MKTKAKVKLPTLVEVEQFDMEQCTSNLEVLATKLQRWRSLEQALIVRRDSLFSQHNTKEGGWFQQRGRRGSSPKFGRISKRGPRYSCGDYYFLITLSQEGKDEQVTHFVLNLLGDDEPFLVKAKEVGNTYLLKEDSESVARRSRSRGDTTFFEEWEEVSPLSLVTLFGGDPIELMRDHWEYIIAAVAQHYNMEVVKYKDKWHQVKANLRM